MQPSPHDTAYQGCANQGQSIRNACSSMCKNLAAQCSCLHKLHLLNIKLCIFIMSKRHGACSKANFSLLTLISLGHLATSHYAWTPLACLTAMLTVIEHMQELWESQLMARRQLCSITIIVDVPTSGLGHATLEELSLSLRDDFYDRLGRLLPDVSSSPQLVLDTHHGPDVSSSSQLMLETHQMPTKSLKIGCSLPAQLVPSMAVALMLSKALITALTVACHRLDCLQYGYTMLLKRPYHTGQRHICSQGQIVYCGRLLPP